LGHQPDSIHNGLHCQWIQPACGHGDRPCGCAGPVASRLDSPGERDRLGPRFDGFV